MTSKTVIDDEEYLRLIDQMRISIPQEVKRAQQIIQDREQIIAQAQEKAQNIIALAQEQAGRLVEEHEIRQRADQRAQEIIEQAQHEANRRRVEADTYALDVLRNLEGKLASFQAVVANGIELLEQQHREAPDEEPVSTPAG